jgi:hypothetical protein
VEEGYYGGGRTNLLEELGRVEAKPSNPNRRAEISRVHSELNRGYAKVDVLELKMASGFKKWREKTNQFKEKRNERKMYSYYKTRMYRKS